MAEIPSTPADGNVKVVWVPTLADPTAPTVAELTAAGVVDVSCYLTADGWSPGMDEQVISDDRLCSVQTFEQPGRSSRTLSVKYIENPGSATDNKAYTTFTPGTSGFLVQRRGKPFDTAFAAADVVDVWPATTGKYDPQPPEANSVLKVAQKMFITGTVEQNVAVTA